MNDLTLGVILGISIGMLMASIMNPAQKPFSLTCTKESHNGVYCDNYIGVIRESRKDLVDKEFYSTYLKLINKEKQDDE